MSRIEKSEASWLHSKEGDEVNKFILLKRIVFLLTHAMYGYIKEDAPYVRDLSQIRSPYWKSYFVTIFIISYQLLIINYKRIKLVVDALHLRNQFVLTFLTTIVFYHRLKALSSNYT